MATLRVKRFFSDALNAVGLKQGSNLLLVIVILGLVGSVVASAYVGAEIGGVDLSRPLDAETLRQIKDAWHEHTVLLFRSQRLSEDDQRRFASYFGPVAKRVPPKPGATGVGDAPEWDDMMLVSGRRGQIVGFGRMNCVAEDQGKEVAIDAVEV